VLNETYTWINVGESNVKNKLIPEEEYLTKNTAEGLRVTIRSSIELSTYLLKECGFKYVLSHRFILSISIFGNDTLSNRTK